MSDLVRVTCFDPETGESQTQELDPHSYVLVCGKYLEFAYEQWHPNGTVQLTLRRRTEEAS